MLVTWITRESDSMVTSSSDHSEEAINDSENTLSVNSSHCPSIVTRCSKYSHNFQSMCGNQLQGANFKSLFLQAKNGLSLYKLKAQK